MSLYKAYNIYEPDLTWDKLGQKITDDISEMLQRVSHADGKRWMVVVGIKEVEDYHHPLESSTIKNETIPVSPKLTNSPG